MRAAMIRKLHAEELRSFKLDKKTAKQGAPAHFLAMRRVGLPPHCAPAAALDRPHAPRLAPTSRACTHRPLGYVAALPMRAARRPLPLRTPELTRWRAPPLADLAMFALSVVDPEKSNVAAAKEKMTTIVRFWHKQAESQKQPCLLPEHQLPWLLHTLGHHPDFESELREALDEEAERGCLETTQRCIDFFLGVVHNDGYCEYERLRVLVGHVKRAVDRLAPRGEQVRIAADVARTLIVARGKDRKWSSSPLEKDKCAPPPALHAACCMLHAACCMLHAASRMLRAACCVLHAACCMLRPACCVLHADRVASRRTASLAVGSACACALAARRMAPPPPPCLQADAARAALLQDFGEAAPRGHVPAPPSLRGGALRARPARPRRPRHPCRIAPAHTRASRSAPRGPVVTWPSGPPAHVAFARAPGDRSSTASPSRETPRERP